MKCTAIFDGESSFSGEVATSFHTDAEQNTNVKFSVTGTSKGVAMASASKLTLTVDIPEDEPLVCYFSYSFDTLGVQVNLASLTTKTTPTINDQSIQIYIPYPPQQADRTIGAKAIVRCFDSLNTLTRLTKTFTL